MNQKIIIALIISATIIIAAGILAFGMMNTNHEEVIIVNNTTGNNTTGVNTTVEHVNHDDSSNQGVSQSQSSDDVYFPFKDADGFYHYMDENGNEMVGNPYGQHMDIDTHNYVKEHGMA